jgi:hypothetical protein
VEIRHPITQYLKAMDTSEPVVVAWAWVESEASVIKSLLGSYGIRCHYSSEFPTRFYPVASEKTGHIRIFVPGPLAQEARAILEEHRRHGAPLQLVEDDAPGGGDEGE